MEGPKRVSIEMTSTRNGLPFGMAAEQPPKAPLAHSPRPIRPFTQCAPYPNYSGAFGPAIPKSPFPQGDARSAFKILHVHIFGKQGGPEAAFVVTFSANKGTQKKRALTSTVRLKRIGRPLSEDTSSPRVQIMHGLWSFYT